MAEWELAGGAVRLRICEQLAPSEMSPLFSDAWTGSRVWEAAPVLAQHMASQGADFLSGALVLELGAGTGLVGLFCAQFGQPQRVLLTDQSALLPCLRRNAELNGARGGVEVRVACCDWARSCEDILGLLEAEGAASKLLVLASDCLNPLYGEHNAAHLAQTVAAISQAAESKGLETLALVSQTRRGDNESMTEFLEHARRSLRCARVKREGHVDVWDLRLHGTPTLRVGAEGEVPTPCLTGSTADSANRRMERYKVQKRLRLPEYPGSWHSHRSTAFFDKAGLLVARGYTRVVFGDHGSYVEFSRAQIQLDEYFEFRCQGAYYDIWKGPRRGLWQATTASTTSCAGGAVTRGPEDDVEAGVPVRVQAYWQKHRVSNRANPPSGAPTLAKVAANHERPEGYADYAPGMFYVSPRKLEVQHVDADTGEAVGPRLRFAKPDKPPRARRMRIKRTLDHHGVPASEWSLLDCEKGIFPLHERAAELGFASAATLGRVRVWLPDGGGAETVPDCVVTVTSGVEEELAASDMAAVAPRNSRSSECVGDAAPARWRLATMKEVEGLTGANRWDTCLPIVPLFRSPSSSADGAERASPRRSKRQAAPVPMASKKDVVIHRVVAATVLISERLRDETTDEARGALFDTPSGLAVRISFAELLRLSRARVVALSSTANAAETGESDGPR